MSNAISVGPRPTLLGVAGQPSFDHLRAGGRRSGFLPSFGVVVPAPGRPADSPSASRFWPKKKENLTRHVDLVAAGRTRPGPHKVRDVHLEPEDCGRGGGG